MFYFIQNTLEIGKVYISETTYRFMISKQLEVKKKIFFRDFYKILF